MLQSRIKLHPQLEPFDPGPQIKRAHAAHLLQRAAFGGTIAEIDQVMKLGIRRSIEQLLDFPDANADEQSKTDVPDLSGISGYPRTFAERQDSLKNLSAEERNMAVQKMQAGNRQATFATIDWWMRRMAVGAYPLQEKLTLFWHGHFTTSARDERSAWLMWQQNETLRRNAAGNFRSFVKSISRDPAMLDYLNNQQNRKGRPNENYARELMELFTLGIGNYTENDIKEAARAFTGWGHDGEAYLFRRQFHDDGVKTFFGKSGKFGGDDVIDIILSKDTSGDYIAARFLKFFVGDNTDPQIAHSLGDVLRANEYEMRPMLRTLFASKLFFSSQYVGTQIKSPVQLVVGTSRIAGVTKPRRVRTMQAMEAMGQVPFMPPNVKGWPGGRSWINTSTLLVRYNTAVDFIGSIADDKLVPPGVERQPIALVDHYTERFIQRPISEDKRQVLINQLGQKPDNNSVRRMVELVVSMPEYQLG
jgi:uncharacterized protein (DUF1800 family)